MLTQRTIRFALMPLTALALLAALVFLTATWPKPVSAAAGTPDQQQMRGAMPMTNTMPVTAMMPAMMEQMMQMMDQMQQMQSGMGQGSGMMGAMTGTMPMTGALPMRQYGLGTQMEMMGRMMQMMGMMQEMAEADRPMTPGAMPMGRQNMPHMLQMMGQMIQMMGMMQQMQSGMMGGTPVTGTMPMTGAMPMGQGMAPGMMTMMGEMSQMMGMMQGMMGGNMPMTTTAPLSDTTGAALLELPQTAQAGAVEIKVMPTNLPDAKAETIDFAVELNSHSEEIDLDLAKTAKLRIGTEEVAPIAWETATPQGHHVKGVLRFARADETGKALLNDATEISLVLGGLPGDVERAFTWKVNPQ